MELIRTKFGVSVRTAGEGGRDLPLNHIIGVGRNYAAHAQEQGADVPERPMFFCKRPTSAILDGEAITIPAICRDRPQVDFEGELAIVIGRAAKDVPEQRALDHVLGICCANDVSARWWQKQGAGGQFYRGKSFDTFCPLGPRLTALNELGDLQSLSIRTTLNDEIMQDASTDQMIFPVAQLISELSRGATLAPGTVILTGTPSGVGMSRDPQRFLEESDRVTIEIEGLGSITNVVQMER